MAKSAENNLSVINLIASTTKIVGDINTSTDIRIDGMLNGNLITSGRLIVGEKGSVIGEINCETAEIEGTIEGVVIANGLLSLKSSSKIKGDVTIGQLMIEPGAVFSGNCKMKNSTTEQLK